MKRQFVVIGLGAFGANVALNLAKKNADVLAVDIDEKRVEEVAPYVTKAVQADATEEKTLRTLGIADADTAIVSVGDSMEASILITLLLEELDVKKVIVKGLNNLHAQVLSKIGADRIIFPERDMAEKLAESLVSPNIIEEIELSPEYNFVEFRAPQSFVGKTLRDLDIRAKYQVYIVGIKRNVPVLTDSGETNFEEEMNIAPQASEEIEEGDILVVLGKNKDVERLKGVL